MADFVRDKEGKILSTFSDDFDTVPRSKWEPVTIPAETVMGDAFPSPSINNHKFAAGQEHMAPPSYVEHLKLLIDRHQKDSIRRLRPTADLESIQQQAGLGNSPAAIRYQPV